MAGLSIPNNRSLLNAIRPVMPKGTFVQYVERENHPALQLALDSNLPKDFTPTATTSIELKVEVRPGNTTLQTTDMFQKTSAQRGGTLETASWSTFRQEWKIAFDQEELLIAGGMAKNPELLYNYVKQKKARASADTCNEFDSKFTFGPRTLAQLAKREVRGVLQLVGFSMNQTNGAYVANPDGDFVGQRQRLMSGEVVTLRDGIDPTLPQNVGWRNWAATDDERGMSFGLLDKIDLACTRTNFTASTMQIISPEAIDAPKKVAKPENNYSEVRRHMIFLSERRHRAIKMMGALGHREIGSDPYAGKEITSLAANKFTCMRRLGEVFGDPIIGIDRQRVGLWRFPGMWEQAIEIDGEDGSDTTMIEGYRYIGSFLNRSPRLGAFVIHGSW
jgi:hypothetical protein